MHEKVFRPVTIGTASALIAITTFISYAIGLFRDRILAVNFGTSSATDTYNASFLIPDTLFNLFIAGALTAAFLPIFTDYLIKDKKKAYEIANTMLTTATLAICLLSIVAFIFMPQIINFSFSSTPLEIQIDIIGMTRIMLASAVLFAISNTLGNILMSYQHFMGYAISPILYNLGIIFGVTYLNDNFGIYSAAIGVAIGAALHCLVRIIDILTTDYKYTFNLNVKDEGFKKILKLMVPKSLSLIAWQINLYIFAIVGMKLIEGGLAAFHFARNIQSFAVSIFGVTFATAVFPSLANAISMNNQEKFTSHIQKTIQRMLFFTIPAAAGIMFLARPLIELILSGGVFDENSIFLTSSLLVFFGISIPFESLTHILSRGFYAKQNTLTPTILNIIGLIITAFATLFLAPRYGIEWFSIGFASGFVFYAITLIFYLKKYLKGFAIKSFGISLAKTLIATGIMIIAILVSEKLSLFMPLKVAHSARILIGATIFFIVSAILKSPEISSIKYVINRLLKKNNNEQNT